MNIDYGTAHPDAQKQAPVPVRSQKGVRSKTAETIHSEKLMRQGIPEQHGMTYHSALNLGKRIIVAKRLGTGALNAFQTLFSYSNPKDWEGGQHPIVWPGNDTLAEKSGVKNRAWLTNLRKLTDAGIVVHTSAGLQRRKGSRDADGKIVAAVGISLAPIIIRCNEYYAAAAKYEAGKQKLDAMKKTRTELIASVRTLICAGIREDVDIDWDRCRARLDLIRERDFAELPDLEARITELAQLHDECEKLILEDENVRTKLAENEDEFAAALDLETSKQTEEQKIMEASEAAEDEAPKQQAKPPNVGESWGLNTGMVHAAAPFIRNMSPDIRTWMEIKRNAKQFATFVGIGPVIFGEAVEHLGIDIATAIIVLTVQKFIDGEVKKPVPYARSLINSGRQKELRLAVSYRSLANTKIAEAAYQNPKNTGFPEKGSIEWSVWGQITKDFRPDSSIHINVYAKAFRQAAAKNGTDLSNPDIQDDFIRFLQNWKVSGTKSRSFRN